MAYILHAEMSMNVNILYTHLISLLPPPLSRLHFASAGKVILFARMHPDPDNDLLYIYAELKITDATY